MIEYKHMNASGGGSIHSTLEAAQEAMREYEERRLNRTGYEMLEPQPLKSLGIFAREVSEWRRVGDE